MVWFAPKESSGLSRADSSLFNSNSDSAVGVAEQQQAVSVEAAGADDSTTDLLQLAAENALRNRANSESLAAEDDNCWTIGGTILTDHVKGGDDIDLDGVMAGQYVDEDEASDRGESDQSGDEDGSDSDEGGWSDEAEGEGGYGSEYGSRDGYSDGAEQSAGEDDYSRHSQQPQSAEIHNGNGALATSNQQATAEELKCEEDCPEASGVDDTGRVILSSFVFLNPIWLNKAIKGVINREAMQKIESDRCGGFLNEFGVSMPPREFVTLTL